MANTAVPINADGSASINTDGSAILSDPAAMQCCCCCSATVNTECSDDDLCTPDTFNVTIPALTFAVGCQNCAVFRVGSWEVDGTFGEQSFCLEQVSDIAWEYDDQAYNAVVVTAADDADCATPCYTTNRLFIRLTVSGGTAHIIAYLEDLSAGTCGTNPTCPGCTGYIIFDSTIAVPANFCRDGGSFPGVAPLTGEDNACGFDNRYDNPWATTTSGGTATATPCCEVPI